MFEGKHAFARLGDYCSRITKGTTPTTAGFHFQDAGVNFIKVESIDTSGEILCDKVAHIGDDCHQAFSRSQLRDGDILFSIAGAIGRSTIIHANLLPANTNQALAIIRLKDDAPLNRIYLRQALSSDAVRIFAEKTKKGVAQINLSLKDVDNFVIPLPPLSLQEEFAHFAEQADKSQFCIQQELKKLTLLKESLMHKYFD